MKKFVVSALIYFVFMGSSNAQSWSSVGSGMAVKGIVSAMIVYNGELYVAGEFDSAGGIPVNNIARWNGSVWDSVGSGLSGLFNERTSMAVYNGNLYVGGGFTQSGSISLPGGFAMYDGTSWHSIANADSIGAIGALYTYDSLLFVGFNAECKENCELHFSQFDGIKFYPIGYDFEYVNIRRRLINPYFYSITLYHSEIWAGGDYHYTGSTSSNDIDSWDGATWNYNGNGMQEDGTYKKAAVTALTSDNNYLYAGGTFNSANKLKVSNIAEWNGTMWDSLGKGVNKNVTCLIIYSNNLVAGGYFDSAGGKLVNEIAYWDGTNWGSLGGGVTHGSYSTQVLSLAIYNGDLYVGGEFAIAGGVSANNIAMYSGPLGIKNIFDNRNCNIFPNPNNGSFTLSLSNVTEKCNVEIYNIMGEKVNIGMLKQVQHDYEINLSSQPSGVYFYQVLNEDGSLVGEGKVIVQR
jgi:hypothetical protein